MPTPLRSYRLTGDLVAAHGGGPVVCLAAQSMGQRYTLHASRPGPGLNRSVVAGDPSALPGVIVPESLAAPDVLLRVDIRGPIAQRCESVDPCGGFVDGHDTIAARLIAALEAGDVLAVFDSPGGSYSGGEQAIACVLAAKAKYGRRITGWVDELCASMGFWWAACICDEIFAPIAGQIGSIGARSVHSSEAGALAQAGIVPTLSYWPNEGKIDGVAELPLSAGGKARMDRSVSEAGESFARAVSLSPFGKAHGLTRDTIVALSADCLSAPLALKAGLIDGIATFGEVQSYALAMMRAGGSMAIKGEGAPPEKDKGDDEPQEGLKPSSACASCNMGNQENAKFCAQCGTSMAALPVESAEPGEDDDGAEPKSTPKPGASSDDAPPKKFNPSASIAAILGASSDSIPAIKAAAIQLRQIRDTAAGITGQVSSDGIVGGLLSVPSRLEAAAQIQAARKIELASAKKTDAARRVESEKAERHALCIRGIATGAPEMARGRVMRDVVSASGERTGIELHAQYAEMKIGTLRGLVEGLESSATPKNPFSPDKTEAERVAKVATGSAAASFSPAEKKTLEKHPSVQLLQRRGSALGPAKIVESLIATDPTSARSFLAQNGAAA